MIGEWDQIDRGEREGRRKTGEFSIDTLHYRVTWDLLYIHCTVGHQDGPLYEMDGLRLFISISTIVP